MPIDNSTRFPKPLAADLRELSEGMAIVIDGDTAPKAIASGQYLFIKNHSTLATGGYHATAAIASGADITSSNVTPDADGIVNGAVGALSEQIGTLDSQITGIQSIASNKTASDFPVGIFPILWPSGVTIGGVTIQGNRRGIACNTGAFMHAFVSNVSTGDGYSIGLQGSTWVVKAF